MSLGPQDGDLDEADTDDDEDETPPSNGAHPHAGAPDIKITFPKGKKKAAVVEGQAELDALVALGGGGGKYTVEALAPPEGWPAASVALGILPFTLSVADLVADVLAKRVGGGTFRFMIGKHSRVLTLVGAPRNHGPSKPAESDTTPTWVQTPQGPQLVYLPRGVPPPPPMMSGWGGWGGQQQAPQQDVAKAVLDGLKPLLEALTKRDDGKAGTMALEIEKMKLEQAREEAKARVAEAKEARLAQEATAKEARLQREAELRAQTDLEGKRLAAQADAQVKAAEAMAKAQTEMAQASVKQAEIRAKGEETSLDKMAKMRDLFAPEREGPGPLAEAMEMYKAFRGLEGKKDLAQIIFEGAPALITAAGREVRAIAATMPVPPPAAASQQLPPGQAPPAPPPNGLTPEVQERIKDFATTVKTLLAAIPANKDPAAIVNALRTGAPKTMEFVRGSTPDDLVKQAMLLAGDERTEAHIKADIAALGALAVSDVGKAWLAEFFSLAKR